MNKEEFLEKYQGKAVHCDTEEKSSYFLKMCDSFGIVWCSGDKPLEYNKYHIYKEKTCYNINNHKLFFGNMSCYIRKKIDIVIFIIKEKE